MRKIAFFAFRGDDMCFMHLVLNAIDFHNKGVPVKIIMEGGAVTIIEKLEKSENKPYLRAKEMGLFDCICKACSAKLGVLEYNETVGIPLKGNLEGHPAMEDYIKDGYEIITL